jgi:hypothetical protein
MAKISTYPNVSTPTLPDMLIGTEVTDNNATKNFMISDILGLIGSLGVYVPYTGATANVNLGTFTLSSGGGDFFGPVYLDDALLDGAGVPGTVGQVLSSTVTGTQWINASSIGVPLQLVLDTSNSADQDMSLTGGNNIFDMTGANSLFRQTGANSYIEQQGASSFIAQTGLGASIYQSGGNAFIRQIGAASFIEQQGVTALITQTGASAIIEQAGPSNIFQQTGATAIIRQTGASAYIEQQGAGAYIYQQGANALILQTGANAYISQTGILSYFQQTGADAYIFQSGANAYILQTGANAYISQTNASAYMEPAQIKDSTAAFGLTGQVLVSLGSGLGIEWQDKNQIGSFYDTTTQTTTVGIARPMKFGNDDIVGLGVSVTVDGSANRTQIEVTTAGYYDIQFSAQLRNGAGGAEADIWFRKNGSDIANSNTSVTMQANSYSIAAWNYFVQLNPGDVLQVMWTQNSNNLTILADVAAAPHPATPSTIVTVNRVR